jgi:hypothetical protein
MSFGRNFQILPEPRNVVLSVRIEFQNIFNRMFLQAPGAPAGATGPGAAATNTTAFTTTYPSGLLSGGFGYSNAYNGAGTRPRSGQIVARITF